MPVRVGIALWGVALVAVMGCGAVHEGGVAAGAGQPARQQLASEQQSSEQPVSPQLASPPLAKGQLSAPPPAVQVEGTATGAEPTSPAGEGSVAADAAAAAPARRPDDPFSLHVTLTEIERPEPGAQDAGLVRFEPFGPPPGMTDEQFATLSGVVEERFLAGAPVSPERLAALDEQLQAVHPIDATPAYINALLGLDMADAHDVLGAAALTSDWYQRQLRYKHVVLDGDSSQLDPAHVRNRLLVIDGWVRFWRRTLAMPRGVETLRGRVDNLASERAWARKRQQLEYEQKQAQHDDG